MKIALNKGRYATVDEADYERCMEGPQWYAWASRRRDGSIRTHYAARNIINPNRSRTVQFMHRFILRLLNPKAQADHEDGNGLNNCRNNLIKSNNIQNSQNRKRLDPRSTSGIAGVYRDKTNDKWVAEIIVYGEYKFLGRFSSLRDAKKVRRKAEREREQRRKV